MRLIYIYIWHDFDKNGEKAIAQKDFSHFYYEFVDVNFFEI